MVITGESRSIRCSLAIKTMPDGEDPEEHEASEPSEVGQDQATCNDADVSCNGAREVYERVDRAAQSMRGG